MGLLCGDAQNKGKNLRIYEIERNSERYTIWTEIFAIFTEIAHEILKENNKPSITPETMILSTLTLKLLEIINRKCNEAFEACQRENEQKEKKLREWEIKHPHPDGDFNITLEESLQELREFKQWRSEYEAINIITNDMEENLSYV